MPKYPDWFRILFQSGQFIEQENINAGVAVPTETFGDLLKYLRRRARLTQHELALAVGYTEAHICRLEKNERLPELTTLAALFIPALEVENDPVLMEKLLTLAARSRGERRLSSVSFSQITIEHQVEQEIGALEEIPAPGVKNIFRQGLVEALHSVLENERGVVLCGMAGLGKTALAAEVARFYTSGPVFWHTLLPGVTNSIESMTRQLALFFMYNGNKQVLPLVETHAGNAPMPLDRKLALLRLALAQQPVLLCFDDVHYLKEDEAGLLLLRHLIATTSARLLLTSREDLPLPIHHINITGLEEKEARALIEKFDLDIDPALTDSLIARTKASPMLLQLAAGQMLSPEVDAREFIQHLETQPPVATYLVYSVLSGLSPAAQWLVELISIFRHPVDLYDETLISLIDNGNLPAALAELQQRHLIDDPRRALLHPLVKDHVYASLATRAAHKRQLHCLAAEWSECAAGDIQEAAFHYSHAGKNKEAVELIVGREDLLIQRGQALSTADILGEMLVKIKLANREGKNDDLLRCIYTARGYLLTDTLKTSEAEADFRMAIELAANPQVTADLVSRISRPLLQRNRYEEVLQLAQAAVTALSPADILLKARLFNTIASAQYNLSRFTEAQSACREVLGLIDQFTNVPWSLIEELRAYAYYVLANVARIQRDQPAALVNIQHAINSAHKANLPRLENNLSGFLGGLLFDQGDVDGSYAIRGKSLAMAQSMGEVYQAAYLMIHLCGNHYIRCEPDEALAKLEQSRIYLQQIGDAHGLADLSSMAASCLLLRGQVKEARAEVDQLLRLPGVGDRQRMVGYYLNKLAIVQITDDSPDASGAQGTLHRALELPVVASDPMLRFELNTTLAMVKLVGGEPDGARILLSGSLPQNGLSLWSKLDRRMVEGFVALGTGQRMIANDIITELSQRAGGYKLYRLRIDCLTEAFQDSQNASFPRIMWAPGR